MIYRHPFIDTTDFNLNYFNDLLAKISKFLLGDFNINLLSYNEHRPATGFLDSLASNSLLPYILQPIRLTGHSKTFTDNIFCNLASHEVISLISKNPIRNYIVIMSTKNTEIYYLAF